MLSIFPVALSYSMAVPLAFRLAAGVIFVVFGYENAIRSQEEKTTLAKRFNLKSLSAWLWVLIALEMVGGLLFIIGLFTQPVALVLSILSLAGAALKYKDAGTIPASLGFLLLLFLVTCSLLFLGPGFYALDLPL